MRPLLFILNAMNLPLQFFILGAMGFAIGAGTNDLAIRWVFWALFAKKKQAIADAIQTVVSRELMSPEKIASRLASQEVADSLRSSLLAAITSAASRPLPSLDVLAAQYTELRFGTLQDQIAAFASDAVIERFAETEFRTDVLLPFLTEQWQRLAPCCPADLLPAHTRDLLVALPDRLAAAVLAPEHRERLCEVIDSGLRSWMADYPTPASFLGSANTEELAVFAGSRSRFLGGELASLLTTPPAQTTLREAIRTAVHSRIDKQGLIGSLLTGLAGATVVESQLAKFCESLPDAVRSQFSDEGDAERMRGLVETAVRKLAGRTWNELLDAAAPDGIKKQIWALLGSEAVRDMVHNGFVSMTTSVLDNLQTGTLEEASSLLASECDTPVYLDWLAETLQTALCSSNLRPQLKRQTEQAVHRLCTRPIGPPDRFLPESAKPQLAEMLADQVTAFARANVADLAERTRIWDIISESITIYDEKKMEKIVRGVANRELRWVTLLGGGIGFAVGIAQGLLLLLLDYLS